MLEKVATSATKKCQPYNGKQDGHSSRGNDPQYDLCQAQRNKEMLARQWRVSRLLKAFDLRAIINFLTTTIFHIQSNRRYNQNHTITTCVAEIFSTLEAAVTRRNFIRPRYVPTISPRKTNVSELSQSAIKQSSTHRQFVYPAPSASKRA